MQNGKGDKPKNCFSEQYRLNYEAIDWGKVKGKTKYLTMLDDNWAEIDLIGGMKRESKEISLKEMTKILAEVRKNQPKVTLKEAQEQARRVMAARGKLK